MIYAGGQALTSLSKVYAKQNQYKNIGTLVIVNDECR